MQSGGGAVACSGSLISAATSRRVYGRNQLAAECSRGEAFCKRCELLRTRLYIIAAANCSGHRLRTISVEEAPREPLGHGLQRTAVGERNNRFACCLGFDRCDAEVLETTKSRSPRGVGVKRLTSTGG